MRLKSFALSLCLLSTIAVVAAERNWQQGTLTATERQKIREGSTSTTHTDSSARDRGSSTDYSHNSTTTKSDNYENYQVYTIQSGDTVYTASEHLLFPWSKPANTALGKPIMALAQLPAGTQYGDAVRAFQQGDTSKLIQILEPIVRSDGLKGAELGRVWLLLGASYRAAANYDAAQRAYDHTLTLFKDDSSTSKEYAVALRESGGLARELGDFDSSERLEKQSLQLSEKDQDHTAIARACEGLAELSFDRGNLKQAGLFISRSQDEARLTNGFDEDDRAYLVQLQGWLALKTSATQNAITSATQNAINDYQQAIDLFTARYGITLS